MFNPIRQGALIECYGNYGFREECRQCLCRGYCKEAAKDRKLIEDYSKAGQYAELVPDQKPEKPEDAKPDQFLLRKFDCEDLLTLVRFFLDLSPFEFEILRRRLANPHMTMRQLRDELRMTSDRRMRDFFKKKCAEFPLLSEVLFISQRQPEVQSHD